jgi:hypothetical protein
MCERAADVAPMCNSTKALATARGDAAPMIAANAVTAVRIYILDCDRIDLQARLTDETQKRSTIA